MSLSLVVGGENSAQSLTRVPGMMLLSHTRHRGYAVCSSQRRSQAIAVLLRWSLSVPFECPRSCDASVPMSRKYVCGNLWTFSISIYHVSERPIDRQGHRDNEVQHHRAQISEALHCLLFPEAPPCRNESSIFGQTSHQHPTRARECLVIDCKMFYVHGL